MPVTLTDEQWDEMLEQIDTLDNLKTSLVNLTTLPYQTHVDALRGQLPAVVTSLNFIVSQVEGTLE